MTENSLFEKVEEWAKVRGIDKNDPSKQMLKVVEEVGEVAAALARSDREELLDGIGDSIVTLIILAQQSGLNALDCLESAYNVIAARKGKVINGVFVKEEDLPKSTEWTPSPEDQPTTSEEKTEKEQIEELIKEVAEEDFSPKAKKQKAFEMELNQLRSFHNDYEGDSGHTAMYAIQDWAESPSITNLSEEEFTGCDYLSVVASFIEEVRVNEKN